MTCGPHLLCRRLRTSDRDAADGAVAQREARKPRGGPPMHSFRPLLQDLATVTRNVCRTNDRPDTRKTEFEFGTLLSAEQARALELLEGIRS